MVKCGENFNDHYFEPEEDRRTFNMHRKFGRPFMFDGVVSEILYSLGGRMSVATT